MFPPTPTWPLALGGCWGSAFWRTSTIRSLLTTSLISGGAACLHGNVVPGLCVYPAGRQQGRTCQAASRGAGPCFRRAVWQRQSLSVADLRRNAASVHDCSNAAEKGLLRKAECAAGTAGADICRLRRTRLCVGGVHGVIGQQQLQSVPVLPILR